jgi:hypothetical protein
MALEALGTVRDGLFLRENPPTLALPADGI